MGERTTRAQDTVMFATRIPRKLHKQMRLTTTDMGISMTSVLVDLMEKWLKDQEVKSQNFK